MTFRNFARHTKLVGTPKLKGFSEGIYAYVFPLQRNVTRNVLKVTILFAARMGLRIPTNVTSNIRRAFTRRKSLSGTKVNVKFKRRIQTTAELAPKNTNPFVALTMSLMSTNVF